MSLFKKLFSPITAVLDWLMPDPPELEQNLGVELTKAATDAYIGKVYGKVERTTGTIIFKETSEGNDASTPNELLHIIIVWAESVESIDAVYADGVDMSSNSNLFVSNGRRYAYATNFPNGMVGYSDPYLTKAGWRTTDNVEGKACTYIRLQNAEGENLLRSEPQFTADLTGTTHSNPALALRNYLTSDKFGKNLPDSFLNLGKFSTAAGICDDDVEEIKDSGQMRKLFTIDAKIDTSATVFENCVRMLKSMRAMMPVLDGKLTPIIEKDDPPVSLTISDEDPGVEFGDITNSNKSNRYNRVIVTYIDNDANATKQEAIYPPKDSTIETNWLAEDNGVLLETSVNLDTCRNYYEALAFAKAFAEISREQLSTEITLPLWGTLFEVGDIVNVSNSKAGWSNKPFRIVDTTETDDQIKLKVREHQPYIYDFENTGLKPTFPDTSNPIGRPNPPDNITKQDVYNDLRQIDITWTGDTTRYEVVVENIGGDIVHTETVLRKKVELRNLEQDSYTLTLRAINSLGVKSDPVEYNFVVDQEQNSYTWIAYAESDSGLNISTTDSASKTHVGIAPGQPTPTVDLTKLDKFGFFPKPTGGTAGSDGKSVAQITFFRRASSKPAKPANNSASYNFGTNTATPPAGWSTTIPTGTDQLYATSTTFVVTGSSATDNTSVFSDVVEVAQNGEDAEPTKSYYTARILRRSATPLSTPIGGSYNFNTNTLTAPTGWQENTPGGTDPVYESFGVFSIFGFDGTDNTVSWSAPEILVKNGEDGVSIASTTEFYKLTNSETKPTIASGGWTTTPPTPTASNRFLWNYNRINYSNGSTSNTNVIRVTQYVSDGRGISSIVEAYQRHNSGTNEPTGTWQSTIAAAGALTDALPFLWNRTTINYTTGSPTVVYSLLTQKGQDGAPGKDGASSTTFKNSANTRIVGNRIEKTLNSNGWNAGAYSLEQYDACTASFSPTTGLNAMVGISNDDGSDADYHDINYAIRFDTDGDVEVWESSSLRGTKATYVQGDVFSIVCDAAEVRYYKNGTRIYTSSVAPSGAYRFDCSINAALGVLENVTFHSSGRKGQQGDPGLQGPKGERGITADAIVGRRGQQWGFENNTLQGWSVANANHSISRGIVTLTSTTADPYLVGPDFPRPIAGDQNYAIRVRVRTTSADHSTTAQLYYETSGHNLNGSFRKDIQVDYKKDEWQYLVFDMRDLTAGGTDWIDNDIISIRVDVANVSGRTYEIDGVVVGYFATPYEANDGIGSLPASIVPATAGGKSDIIIKLNRDEGGNYNRGELQVVGTKLITPAGATRDLITETVFTDFGEGRSGFFYLVHSLDDFGTRCPNLSLVPTNSSNHFIPVIYKENKWVAVDNPGNEEDLTLRSSDVFVAAIVAESDSDDIDGYQLLVSGLDGKDGEDGAPGQPGADAPGSTVIEDTGGESLTVGTKTIYQIPLDAGTWNITAAFSGGATATQFVGGEPEFRPTRVVAWLEKNGTQISGTQEQDPASGFELGQSFSFNISVNNQSAGTYRLRVTLAVSGSYTNANGSINGYLRGAKVS
uniref:hypothetical protein n=1 Tax=Ningiella ruwaisensis TaxID=2364274 RepID=UPI0010A0605F|nr:hypothetical protein [Ningiella ruwaisensis]